MTIETNVRLTKDTGKLKGFAKVILDGKITIEDFKIVENEGILFVGMPSKKNDKAKTGWSQTIYFNDADFKKTVCDEILKKYNSMT